MEQLGPVIKDIVVSGLAVKAAQNVPRHSAAGAGIMFIAGAVFLIAVIFLALASCSYLMPLYGEAGAYALTFGGLLVLSGLLLLAGKNVMQKKQHLTSQRSHEEISRLVDFIADDLAQDIGEPVRQNPKTAVAAAALAGFIAGDFMH